MERPTPPSTATCPETSTAPQQPRQPQPAPEGQGLGEDCPSLAELARRADVLAEAVRRHLGEGAGPPSRAVPPTVVFESPGEVRVGMVVFDRDVEMPGTVRYLDGLMVELVRPTGMVWRVNYRRLRAATAWERRQLRALARLHRQAHGWDR
ncbi:hypothetical protein AQ490_21475 [Wenjunlia vitaminophila]|uniref:Uncharacterized protein n=1 Tax=Wenjunlia vitaminophila TaxID=76728 RepID=A0A0T6LTA4_WENVI|nr:hypothetical protein [Wenjunlia vitaminophila]KRV49177.1 hypothetical protein AQ490_21475 [Wenjunlia vitaminophila]